MKTFHEIFAKNDKGQQLVTDKGVPFTKFVTVEEVHNEFLNADNDLYKEAIEIINKSKINNEERFNMLKSIGFWGLKEVAETGKIKAITEKQQKLADLINYYKVNYPSYKFITKEKIINICNKYGLIFGDVAQYIGTIPDKSLKSIYNFKENYITLIKEEDYKYFYINFSWTKENIETEVSLTDYQTFSSRVRKDCSFKIAAPATDFNVSPDHEIKNFEIVRKVVPDPVVFYPVRGGYLIVEAWGEEASDPNVVNEINN